MQAGALRQPVAFDEPVTTQDNNGEEIITWTQAFIEPASVEPLVGREREIANQVMAGADTRINIRWSTRTALINAKWRARLGTTIYNLGSVQELMLRHREIEIMASSGVNLG